MTDAACFVILMLYGITGDCLDCILWLIIGSRFRKFIHASLLTMSIGSGVIVAVTFQKVDCTPDAQTGTERDNESLKNIDSTVEEIHERVAGIVLRKEWELFFL